MDKVIIGIDLGTTFSAVAYVDDRGNARIIQTADGEKMTPSVVLVQDGQILVGNLAQNQWVTNEEHVVRWVKRAMGNPDFRFQGLSAVEISAEIIKSLKADAETALKQKIEEAVITCPAYFAALEIENTKRAGELAGLKVKEIVKEPTAAAVYYGVEHLRDGEKILVCDLGGGTFDATLLAYDKGVFSPLATAGSRKLGGHDWTMDLLNIVAEQYIEKFGVDPSIDLVTGQMLYEACEQAKRDFARLDKVTILAPYEGNAEPFEVTRETFESRTEWRVQELIMWADETLAKAQKTWKDINCILLVGGSSRLRRMGLALQEASGIQPTQCREPDLSVALGAAILAKGKVRPKGLMAASGGLVDVTYERIIARSLGTRAIVRPRGGQLMIANSLIIPHSTKAPVTCSREDFEISIDNQQVFDVPVVEFESDDDYDPVDNFRFHCRAGAKRGDRIRITFHYDESGIPTVEACDVNTGDALPGERLPYEEPDLEKLKVSVRPRWVVFAIDNSGSMDGIKLMNAKQALLNNARQLIGLGGVRCRVGVVAFSDFAQVISQPTNDLTKLEREVNKLCTAGLTAMDEGIELAVQMLMAAPQGVDRDAVMLTDGMPDTHRRDNTLRIAKDAQKLGITLSTVGVGKDNIDQDFLQAMTPLSLMIETTGDMGAAMETLLTQSAAARGGLSDMPKGGLMEGQKP